MDYEPCLPVVSILASRTGCLPAVLNELNTTWPNLTLFAPAVVFDETQHYGEEIGYPLLRWWGYRNELGDPADLRQWKKKSREIEEQLTDSRGNRTANIDPGYLNYGLLVLGSFKYDLQKIYLGDGVYADPVLKYGEGDFQPFDWSFPDFQSTKYYPVLNELRERYRLLRNQTKPGD